MVANQLISIVLVDDELLFRKGLQTLLTLYSNKGALQFNVVGEAVSPSQAVKVAEEQNPALILMDLELVEEGDGIAALMGLRHNNYKGKVLVLSAHREDELVFRAMQAGANGYVFKDRIANELYDAIATVLNNEVYLAPEVASGFFRMFHFYSGHSVQAMKNLHLTEREQQVLALLVQGAGNEEIAKTLYVTVATVKAHLTAIFTKLGVISRTQAIIKALKLGLISG
jgi:DNA-binding NarL/FixJ family response regulator